MSEFKPYLHSAHIEGYKSIVSCDVTFKPGLNIIIGKNGTGKTNLLEGISKGLTDDLVFFDNEPSFSTKLTFANDEIVQNRIIVEVSPAPLVNFDQNLEGTKLQNIREGRLKVWNFFENESIELEIESLEYLVSCLLFSHSTPGRIPIVSDIEAGWKIGDRVQILNKYPLANSAFTKLQSSIANSLFRLQFTKRINEVTITEVMNHALRNFADRILPSLKACTPVTGLELLEGRITNGILKGQMEVKGYLYNFEVNGNHLAFENLSDGTRRVFMIAVEVSQFEKSYQISMDYNAGLFLLEEPELGIHPHQLQKLMTFLKEQSKEKQIILTTHSPQVLDILNKDELDRIIIADFDPEKGSTFRHLDDKEIVNAQNFMSDMYLSDYWRFSDLEVDKVK